MTDTAIVLAGGFGTRLQAVVKEVPKPMADISGKPFLEYLLTSLLQQGIKKSILSVGYKWETIKNYFGEAFGEMKLEYSIEDEPLGTGGAILKAVHSSDEKEFFIFNGDTFFNINLSDFHTKHHTKNSRLSIALKQMKNFDRYGVVRTGSNNRILSFEEKKFYEAGDINGGIYILNADLFSLMNLPEKFSFEKDVMEKYCHQMPFSGFSFDGYFIDIGIPEDYQRAQAELPPLLKKLPDFTRIPASTLATISGSRSSKSLPANLDKSWALFLDRDGVINKKIDNDYVRNLEQFEWLPGVQAALVQFSRIFGRIIIVSNQQGVGKGLMTMKDVETIHNHIVKTIHDLGGRIDNIYFAPQLKTEESSMRKPEIGMALQAEKDFPEINFSKAIMVGDSMSDMEFGKSAGMKTVFISRGKPADQDKLIDFVCIDLPDFETQIVK